MSMWGAFRHARCETQGVWLFQGVVGESIQQAGEACMATVRTTGPRHSNGRVQVVVLAFVGIILVGVALDVTLMVNPALPSQVFAAAVQLPKGVLVTSGLALASVMVVGGKWEAHRLWKAYQEWIWTRRVARVAPLASALHVSPLALSRVSVQTLHDLSPTDFEGDGS